MGTHKCLFLINSRNKFTAKWRAKRLIKWIEKRTKSMEWGTIITSVMPIDYEKVKEYYNLQLSIQKKALKDIIPQIEELKKYEGNLSEYLFYLERVKREAAHLIDDIPTFTHRIYYDIIGIATIHDIKLTEQKRVKKSQRFRAKGWVESCSPSILFWDILMTANYMVEVSFHH